MQFMEALQIIGKLSAPSKMPGWSWSISAFECQTGGKLAKIEGSVCHNCYARKGRYRFKNVKDAHARRLQALDHPQFEDAFVLVLTQLYKNIRGTYIKDGVSIQENRFRFFDSGDLQSVDMLKTINSICLRCPSIEFWMPTKEAGYVNQFLKQGNKFAPNLNVRLSHSMVGQTFTKKPNGLNFSTVGLASAPNHCPAYTQGGKCLDCRRCWDKNVESVNYPVH